MITAQLYTIRELLYTPAIRYNQSTLAKLLHINRNTLRKYKDDSDNTRHVILVLNGTYVFQCIPSIKATGDKNHAHNAHTNMA